MARRSIGTPSQKVATPVSSQATGPTNDHEEHEKREEIARLALQFWMERGSPVGIPEEDWFRAEAEIRSRSSRQPQTAGDGRCSLLFEGDV